MDLSLMRLVEEKEKNKEEIALITVLSSDGDPGSVGATMVVGKSGEVLWGSIGGGLLEEKAIKEARVCIERGISRKVLFTDGGNTAAIFIKAICNIDRLIIVGSGELALNLYRVARILEFKVVVVDNRTETLTTYRFPEAELLLGDIVENLALCDIDENTSVVIATHNHEFDEPALKAVVFSPARYIGVLSNSRRAAIYIDNLRSLNIPEELLKRVYTPIGLDLGGRKFAEIAVAVMAEILAVKYGGSRDFSRSKCFAREA